MSLTKTIIKMWPTENEMGIHLVITDNDRSDLGEGEQEVIKKTFSRNVPKGNMANKVRDELGLEAQAEINRYKVLRARYDNPIYQTKVTQIDNNLKL